jgi:hypothetical protein
MLQVDMIYCDPPWNLGNVNSFYGKAGREYIDRFSDFYDHLFFSIKQIAPRVCYLEIGRQHRKLFACLLQDLFSVVQDWRITYYGKKECYLLRGGHAQREYDFTGLDERNTPRIAIEIENPDTVADMCTGQGLTAVAAYRLGKRFMGTELNKRRLAVAIDKVNKLGGKYEGPVSKRHREGDC